MYVIKKDGTKEEFNVDKIIAAVNKSASRIMYRFTENEIAFICEYAKRPLSRKVCKVRGLIFKRTQTS